MVVVIVQARMNSMRLPGKVLMPILGIPVIQIIHQRLSEEKLVRDLIIATTAEMTDQPLVNLCHQLGYRVYRGDTNDLVDRYYRVIELLNLEDEEIVVRVTGDCPFIDPIVLDQMLDFYQQPSNHSIDYLHNTGFKCTLANPEQHCEKIPLLEYPDGFDVEIFRAKHIRALWVATRNQANLEHLATLFKAQSSITVVEYPFIGNGSIIPTKWKQFHLSLDTSLDYAIICQIYQTVGINAGLNEITKCAYEILNESTPISTYLMKGQKLYQEAKRIIPGGTQLLSKRPELFLPGQWPAYYHKAQGIEVVDLDGRKYYDFTHNSVGTCILGYSDPDVNAAVIRAVEHGNMCTLNHPSEVKLAKVLCRLHPWASAVRYAKTGGEAMAIAVRIARSHTGRDRVVFCGYHGWHDWYLSSNLITTENLKGHLLNGLNPKGVPKSLVNTAIPLRYNHLEEVMQICTENSDIAAIIMEPVRNLEPEPGFLEGVRALATRIGAVLIFDEITTGFRSTMGGVHNQYQI